MNYRPTIRIGLFNKMFIFIIPLIIIISNLHSVTANPIVIGNNLLELHDEIVEIFVSEENGSLRSYVNCTANMTFDIAGTYKIPSSAVGTPPFDIPLSVGDYFQVSQNENNSIRFSFFWGHHLDNQKDIEFNISTKFYVTQMPLKIIAIKINATVVKILFEHLPVEVIFQFPVPPNAENITIVSNTNQSDFHFVNNSYEYFKDFDIIEWEIFFIKYIYLSVSISYSHLLHFNGTHYNLKYAFGTGRIFLKQYENITLMVRLPKNTKINSITYQPKELHHAPNFNNTTKGVYYTLKQRGGFYLSTENVDMTFKLMPEKKKKKGFIYGFEALPTLLVILITIIFADRHKKIKRKGTFRPLNRET